MWEAFHVGGFGMWPTLVFGVLLIGSAARYAGDPDKKHVPLLLSLGVMTMVSGALGFTMGLAKSVMSLPDVAAEDRWIYLVGLGESLYNIVCALVLVMIAAMAVGVGAARIALSPRLSSR